MLAIVLTGSITDVGRSGAGARGAAARPPPAAPTPRRPDGKPILGSVPGQPVGGWGAGVTTLPRGMNSTRFPFSHGPGRPTTSARSTSSNRIRDARHQAYRGSFRRRTAPSSSRSPTSSACTSWTTAAPTRTGSSTWTDASFPKNIPPTNYGYSIGRWEGDTLVVETRGLNEKFWFDTRGTPHTAQLKLTERFTRSDMNTMKYQATIDDPGAYTKPWTTTEFELALETGRRAVRIHLPAVQLGTGDDAREPGRHGQHALLRSLVHAR